jgi:hypothetical protein
MPIFTPEVLAKASKGIELNQPAQEKSKSKWPVPFAIAGQGLDLATTLYGLSHQATESNPFLPSSAAKIAAVKSGAIAGESYAIHKLQENHPKVAKGLGIAVGSAGIIPGLINLYRMNK